MYLLNYYRQEPDKIVNGGGFETMKSFLRVGSVITLAFVVALLLALLPILVSANPGLTVSNPLILADVNPGQTFTQQMTVSIGATDPATDISVKITGVAQSLNGGYILLDAPQDTSLYSAREFVTVDKNSFHLEPGDSQDITATIQVPQDAGAGGRYAIIDIATEPTAGTGVHIISAIAVPVYLTVTGSQLIHTGRIAELSIGNVTNGQPINILINFQNTGNHHFKVKGEVSVTNGRGQSLGIISIPVTSSSILPGMVRQLQATFLPNGEMPAGTYTISSTVMLEDGTLLDEANSTFQIKALYAPPAAVGNITLAPSSASTLTNEDGGISISFPQGAAVIPVSVSLWNYSAEQLPTAPPGISLGTTCFRVDGLTGLLAKEATVTVRYSADDLGKAGGDASRLRLARWDEGNSQWTVLKTKVDAGTMTLSASSNHMSIWVVVVGAAASPRSTWVTPVAAVAGVIVLTVLVLLLLRGRGRRRKAVK